MHTTTATHTLNTITPTLAECREAQTAALHAFAAFNHADPATPVDHDDSYSLMADMSAAKATADALWARRTAAARSLADPRDVRLRSLIHPILRALESLVAQERGGADVPQGLNVILRTPAAPGASPCLVAVPETAPLTPGSLRMAHVASDGTITIF